MQSPQGKQHADANGSYGAGLRPGERRLACYAASALPSRGRLYDETDCPTRSAFQRDRDRILHTSSFRRLNYKTQVFVFHEGDHFRSRLTHSLEVAQVARTVARQLQLDEDLAEALALAHDLGHPPFGHAGERAIDDAMHAHGGFDHNAQSIRVVTLLERRYAAFDGLNLTWELLEGLAKHNGPVEDAGSPIAKVVRSIEAWRSLELSKWPSAEAQVAALADDIAYLTHDVDDGLRAGLLTLDDLHDMAIVGEFTRRVDDETRGIDEGRVIYEITRRMITAMVADIVTASRASLADLAPTSPDDIRNAGRPIIGFSKPFADRMSALKRELFNRVYNHDRVQTVMSAAEKIVQDLFALYSSDATGSHLPSPWKAAITGLTTAQRARLCADYLAGQTDRYAISEHNRWFDDTPQLR